MGCLNSDTSCASTSLRGARQVPTEPPADATASCEQKADTEDCREHLCWASWRQVGQGDCCLPSSRQ